MAGRESRVGRLGAAILTGLLVLGIAGAVFVASSDATREPGEGDDAAAAADAGATGEGATSSARTRRGGTCAVFGEIRRSATRAPVAGQEVALAGERGASWRVRTQESGSFRFERLPHGGPYELTAAAPSCGTIRIPGIALDRNEQRDLGTLLLDPAVAVTVRVRTLADDPIEGAVVETFAVPRSDDWDWSKARAQIGQAPVPVGRATTDARGEALFPETSVGHWTFRARREGFAAGGDSVTVEQRPEGMDPIVIRLSPGHPLEGRVLGPGDAPIAGALVMAGDPRLDWDLAAGPLRVRTRTDDQGRYAFPALASGQCRLWAGRPAMPPYWVATVVVPLVAHFDIRLEGTGTLAGTVTSAADARPVEGALVRATSWTGGSTRIGEATSDAAGRFRVEMPAGDIHRIDVEREGYVLREPPEDEQSPELHAGETLTRDLVLLPGASVGGVVRGPDGPLPGAHVTLTFRRGDNEDQRTATTDASGAYTFGEVAAGTVLVTAEKEGFFLRGAPASEWEAIRDSSAATEFKVDVPAGGRAVKDLELRRGSVVTGRVVDGDGAPLAGVRVTCPGAPPAPPTPVDGAFRLDGVPPREAAVLGAAKEGWVAAAREPVAVIEGTPVEGVVLRMLRAGVVRGTLARASGGPLREAQVLVARRTPENARWVRPAQWMGRFATSVPVRADGTWESPVAFEAPSEILVRGTALDCTPVDAAAIPVVEGCDVYEVALVLADGVDLAGRVVAKGAGPVAGAQVGVARHRTDEDAAGVRYGSSEPPTVWAVTDAGGSFRVPHLTPGAWDVRAIAPGFLPLTQWFAVGTGAGGEVTLTMQQELTIEGTVVLPDGRPVVGVRLHTPSSNVEFGDSTENVHGSAVTDAAGRFRIAGLAAGKVTVTIGGGWDASANVREKKVEDVPAGTRDLRFVVQAGTTISGRVLDTRRAPVAGAWVWARASPTGDEEPEDDSADAESGADGTFSLVGLGAGPYDVEVTSERHRRRVVERVAASTRDLEVVLDDGLTISGQLVDERGRGIGSVSVDLEPDAEDPEWTSNQYTDDAGRFTITGVAPGSYRVVLSQWDEDDHGWILPAKEKVPAGTSGLRLVALRSASIRGIVVDESGAPVGGALLSAVGGGRTVGSWKGIYSKADGTFEVERLLPGAAYEVRAERPGWRTGSQAEVAAGATNVRLVLRSGLQSCGRLLDAAGDPVRDAKLLFKRIPISRHALPEARTDSEGRSTVTGLDAAAYEACVESDVEGEDSKPCGTFQAGDQDVVLRLQP